jgi:hypothetical protein
MKMVSLTQNLTKKFDIKPLEKKILCLAGSYSMPKNR